MTLQKLKIELQRHANPEKAKIYARFFKTGKGEYGEGDVFLGLTVPQTRGISKNYGHLNLDEIHDLLTSPIHEHRLISLLILIHKYGKSDDHGKNKFIDFYLKNAKKVNNWDLVDLSAHQLLGEYLLQKNKARSILEKLAKSSNVWEKRISIISTYVFIKKYKFDETLKIAGLLLNDKHDLIQKAVGWMLREVGKHISREVEELFLKKYYLQMPRTSLRYAIEHFPQDLRIAYLRGAIGE